MKKISIYQIFRGFQNLGVAGWSQGVWSRRCHQSIMIRSKYFVLSCALRLCFSTVHHASWILCSSSWNFIWILCSMALKIYLNFVQLALKIYLNFVQFALKIILNFVQLALKAIFGRVCIVQCLQNFAQTEDILELATEQRRSLKRSHAAACLGYIEIIWGRWKVTDIY